MEAAGDFCYELAKKIFPITRSLTGEGVRKTLSILKSMVKELEIHEVASGTKAFDWTVPKEWKIEEAYIEDENGKVIDYKENNLHVVGYSLPIDKWVNKKELKSYVFTQEDQPEAIPYVTSYYKEISGFCMSENMWRKLPDKKYHIFIKSELFDGSMTYGEIVFPGELKDEICFSTNICHPSMANNEISGPCVLTALAMWLKRMGNRRYTYRILFIPETIGSIVYISEHMKEMQRNIKAGFVVTCVGDNNEYSYVASRKGNTLADKVLRHVLDLQTKTYKQYTFLQRGSDERQYCSPNVDLPFCTFCRSKFHEYAEYHTSKDDLSFITSTGLGTSLDVLQNTVRILEYNNCYRATTFCEPQMGRRGLYPTISKKNTYSSIKAYQNFLAYADGSSLIDINEKLMIPVKELIPVIDRLLNEKLIEII